MLLSITPALSMGLGYIGLAEGDMLAGAVIVASAFLTSIFVYPFAGHYFVLSANIPVPLTMILKKYFDNTDLTLILGITTREYTEPKP